MLKNEAGTRIEQIEADGRSLVCKTYHPHPALRWRTLLQASRAEREFRALTTAYSAGVACVPPVDRGERRALGCVQSSWITTAFVPDTRPLGDLLEDRTWLAAGGIRDRRRLARRLATLVRALHEAGVLWLTAKPRNVLVGIRPDDGRMLLCDMPYAARFERNIAGTRVASLDLYDLCFRRHRLHQFSRGDRFAMLLAYAEGDRATARRLWQRLARRPRWWQWLSRGWTVGVRSYVQPTARLLVGGSRHRV